MPPTPSTGENGLEKLTLTHPSGARAEVYRYGAHVTSWRPAGGEEALFLSREAQFGGGKAIRGGVPVIFPQFADQGPLPKHGFARVQRWDVAEERAHGVLFRLTANEETRALWPHDFEADLAVDLDAHSLRLALTVRNTGAGAFAFTAALHTYLRVADVEQAVVENLRGVRYIDKAAGGAEREQENPDVSVRSEVDRVYRNAPDDLRLHDRAGDRMVRVEKNGFADTVLWNPWVALAASLPDFGDDEYRTMLCIEAAQAAEPVHLAPGATWHGAQRLEV